MEFSQKHVEVLSLDNLTAAQFLCLAIETSKLLDWVFGNITETGFIAYTNNGLFSWNAEIKLKIKNGLATLQSQSMGVDIIYLHENEKSIQSFILIFQTLKKTLTPEELGSIYENLKAKFFLK
jgi:rhomboid protease GluP